MHIDPDRGSLPPLLLIGDLQIADRCFTLGVDAYDCLTSSQMNLDLVVRVTELGITVEVLDTLVLFFVPSEVIHHLVQYFDDCHVGDLIPLVG